MIPTSELYADIDDEGTLTPVDCERNNDHNGVQYDVVGEDGEIVMRTNRQIVDDPNSQVMTMDEIEAMKAQNTGSGKELIAKILESHSALDQKTAFALAKYTLRKTRKYMKRFSIIPLDVSTLAKWIFVEKEAMKIMELREEMLALIGSWSNIHYTPSLCSESQNDERSGIGGGRWLVIDETAGLLTAYMAEKMGILNTQEVDDPEAEDQNQHKESAIGEGFNENTNGARSSVPSRQLVENSYPHKSYLPSTMNTITVLHSAAQPNLSLLKYFHFDPFNPPPHHPLTTHLKTLSWLQLLSPQDDAGYAEPPIVSLEELQGWKGGKRSSYYRKRRRWERVKRVVDEARTGGYDGFIVASVMDPVSILRHTVPLLRGAAQVVVYSPTIEPLIQLADVYSTARRTAFINDPTAPESMPTDDFPVDPMLLLAPTIHTARTRSWQVLPGRTHPLMTGRGGTEGYVFTATRVLPAEGKVKARGHAKRRKVEGGAGGIRASSLQADTPMAGGEQPVEE